MSFVLGDSLGTKPCVFPCKVAPAGDERYLGCSAGAGRIVLRCDWFRTVGVVSRCCPFPSVHIVGSLASKLPSIIINIYRYSYHI